MWNKDISKWIVLGVWVSSAAACGHSRAYVWVDDLKASQEARDVYRVQAADQLSVVVWNQDGLTGDYTVRDDGHMTLPLIGDLMVTGLTTAEIATRITTELRGTLGETKTTVSLATPRPPMVSVIGEVRTAGQFEIERGEGLLQVLARAGGLNEFADQDDIYVLRRTPEEQRIRFNYRKLVRNLGGGNRFELLDGDTVVVE